ncbi:MAG TPA: FxSxx-COOH system tetratricopeptide repeat protein, partial [Chloroflexia bacterium]
LRDNLMSGKPAALVQAIHGLGGVGKTQIAIEYAYRHAADYEAVLWLVAEEPATLASGFANLAIKFGLATADVSNENLLAELVREWLKHNTRWLLIFDNARTEDSVIGYFPRSQSGHILITSRNRDWRRHAQTIAVNKMEKIEAIEFLLKRTGSEDNEAAAILADELGSLPLALEQAGAYIDQKTVSIADYLSLFKRSLSRVFITSSDYPKSIVATWDLSFQAVEERSPAAVQLLKLCAFMAPDNIPLNMLEAGSEYLPASLRNALSEPLDRADMLGELSHYSLVEVDEEQHTVSMHRLVQAVLRDKLPSQESQTWMAVAVQVVNSGFVYRRDDLNTWPVAANALPHALAVAALPHLQDPLFDDIVLALSHLLNEMGLYLMQRAQYTDARNHFTNTLSIVEANFGSEHSTVAVASNNLGSVLKELGELEGALNNCRRALEIAEAVHGSEHPLVSTILNNVGDILQDLDDLDGALSHFVRALAIDENIFGSEHPIVALRLNNIGTVHRQLGALDGALAYFERALAIGEAVYGPEHPFVSTILNNLGGVFKDLGDLEGARNAYERALAIGEAVYGPEHPTVATKLNNLGTLMEELEDLEGARNAYERALAIDEAVYGPEHPTVAIKLGNIGGVLMQQGKKKEARLYLEKAYRIFLHYLGPAHPKTVVTKSWLDGSYQAKVK